MFKGHLKWFFPTSSIDEATNYLLYSPYITHASLFPQNNFEDTKQGTYRGPSIISCVSKATKQPLTSKWP